jgi:hypothetical protein
LTLAYFQRTDPIPAAGYLRSTVARTSNEADLRSNVPSCLDPFSDRLPANVTHYGKRRGKHLAFAVGIYRWILKSIANINQAAPWLEPLVLLYLVGFLGSEWEARVDFA